MVGKECKEVGLAYLLGARCLQLTFSTVRLKKPSGDVSPWTWVYITLFMLMTI